MFNVSSEFWWLLKLPRQMFFGGVNEVNLLLSSLAKEKFCLIKFNMIEHVDTLTRKKNRTKLSIPISVALKARKGCEVKVYLYDSLAFDFFFSSHFFFSWTMKWKKKLLSCYKNNFISYSISFFGRTNFNG